LIGNTVAVGPLQHTLQKLAARIPGFVSEKWHVRS
jgi:hypothetical protein